MPYDNLSRGGAIMSTRSIAPQSTSELGGISGGRAVAVHLWRLMDEVARARSVEAAYEMALDCLARTLNVSRAAVLVFHGQAGAEKTMRFAAWRGLSEEYRRRVSGHSPWRVGAVDVHPILVPDVRAAVDLAAYQLAFQAERVEALAFIPIAFAGKLLGKFVLYYSEKHSFSDEEVAIAQAIAGYIAFVIEHQRIENDLAERLLQELAAREQAEAEMERRKAVERQQQEEDKRLRLALLAGGMGAWDWDVATGKVNWSPELERIHGLEPGTFAGTFQEFLSFVYAADLERVLVAIEQACGGKSDDYAIEYRILVDNELRWVSAHGRVFRDARGIATSMLGVCSDVTKSKQLEETQAFLADMAEAERRNAELAAGKLRLLVEASASLASCLDPELILKRLAEFAAKNLGDYAVGFSVEDDVIRRVDFVHNSARNTDIESAIAQLAAPSLSDQFGAGSVVRTGEPLLLTEVNDALLFQAVGSEEELALLRQLGARSLIIVPLRARSRTVGALVLGLAGETARRYSREDLFFARELADRVALLIDNARLYRESQRALRARDEMVAVISHDLRNPLGTVVTALTVLELDAPPDKQLKSRESMRRALQQMERLLQDLLDVTRIDAGALMIELALTDIASVVSESISMFAAAAESRGLGLQCSVERELPLVNADRGRIQQVLSNLLANAMKFVEDGGSVSVTVRGDAQGVTISIADTGCGIAAEQLPRLFERFWQATPGSRHGAGLGLAIAKGIIDAHGGSLTAESELGRGSTFRVWLPSARTSCS